jgi:hypothetical protein
MDYSIIDRRSLMKYLVSITLSAFSVITMASSCFQFNVQNEGDQNLVQISQECATRPLLYVVARKSGQKAPSCSEGKEVLSFRHNIKSIEVFDSTTQEGPYSYRLCVYGVRGNRLFSATKTL